MPKRYRIACLPGDGIGPEVMEAAIIALEAVGFEAYYVHGDVGWEFWKNEGNALPERTIKILESTDCCLFGAITSKPKDEAAKELDLSLQGKGLIYYSPIVGLRQMFNLHSNIRPCKAYPGNPLNLRDNIDLVVFRENTEGLYCGVEFHPVPKELKSLLLEIHPKMKKFKDVPLEDMAISLRIFTRPACQSIVKDAFEYAKKFNRRSVAIVEKPNVIRETSGMMVKEARKIAKNYPEVELKEVNIDAQCMWLVKNPQDYDVLAASNMFGDIVSDLSAQLVGGLGFACSGNIGDDYAVFEPTHGSAPKYAGQYKVNPIAMILSAKMMLEWLADEKNNPALKEKAIKIEKAVARVIKERIVITYDMVKRLEEKGLVTPQASTTLEVAGEIARYAKV